MSTCADAFAVIGLPRQAALDPEILRQSFQKKATAIHPDHAVDATDRAGRTVAFAALTEAQRTLASLPLRLRHLRELLEGSLSVRTAAVMDAEMMSLFSEVGAALAAAESVRGRLADASTALARALLSSDVMAVTGNLSSAMASVGAVRAALEASLPAIDAALQKHPPDPGPLRQACGTAGFLDKWESQLRAVYAALVF
jgi:hypothetical protein